MVMIDDLRSDNYKIHCPPHHNIGSEEEQLKEEKKKV